MKKLSVIIFSFFISFLAEADSYYLDHATGWHWYDDPAEQSMQPSNTKKPSDPNAMIESIRQEMSTALNKSIVEPTEENVANYIALQEELNDRAEKFSEVWEAVLRKNPALNYSLKHPTNNIALQVYKEEKTNEKDKAIMALANQTGLFFFYRSDCPYCHRFAPILKSFSERHHIAIIPITLDGISIKEFPNSKTDSGQAAQFNVTMTPALFAVNPYSEKAYPVAYGLISETELRDNIYSVMMQFNEKTP